MENETGNIEELNKKKYMPDEELLKDIKNLSDKFDKILDKDVRDTEIFNNLYSDLRSYKTDILNDLVKPVLLDILQAYEYGVMENEIEKSVTADNILSDLKDILDAYDIEAFETSGDVVDSKRHKIIKTVPTNDKALDKKIAKRISKGYMYGTKILKTERIAIYKYEE